VAAAALGLPLAGVYVAETATDKVPNASPTAASASSDMYGAAGARPPAAVPRDVPCMLVQPRGNVVLDGNRVHGSSLRKSLSGVWNLMPPMLVPQPNISDVVACHTMHSRNCARAWSRPMRGGEPTRARARRRLLTRARRAGRASRGRVPAAERAAGALPRAAARRGLQGGGLRGLPGARRPLRARLLRHARHHRCAPRPATPWLGYASPFAHGFYATPDTGARRGPAAPWLGYADPLARGRSDRCACAPAAMCTHAGCCFMFLSSFASTF